MTAALDQKISSYSCSREVAALWTNLRIGVVSIEVTAFSYRVTDMLRFHRMCN